MIRRVLALILAPLAAACFGWPAGAVCIALAAVPGRKRKESNNEAGR